MRKFFTGLALFCVLIGSAACEAKDSSSSTPAATTSTTAYAAARTAVTSSSTASASFCASKFDRYSELAGESLDVLNAMDTSSRYDMGMALELADAAVNTGRTLVEVCGSYAPTGFASKVEALDDAADSLRSAL